VAAAAGEQRLLDGTGVGLVEPVQADGRQRGLVGGDRAGRGDTDLVAGAIRRDVAGQRVLLGRERGGGRVAVRSS
jgi:hypothetical protein